ncbi:Odorant receptor 57a [Blattella germanica]|nr:Odorant receptor 57a [Blattella germanica]
MYFIKLFRSPEKVNVLQMNLGFLRIFGVLAQQSVNTSRLRVLIDYLLKWAMAVLILFFLFGTTVRLSFVLDDFSKTADTLLFVITHVKSTVKISSLIAFREKFLNLITSIEENTYIKGINPLKREISCVDGYKKLARKICQFTWVTFFLSVSTWFTKLPQKPDLDLLANSTLGEYRRESFFNLWLPVKGAESPYFELFNIFEYLAIGAVYLFVTLMNSSIIVLIIHKTAQFALLAETIENTNIHADEQNQMKKATSNNEITKKESTKASEEMSTPARKVKFSSLEVEEVLLFDSCNPPPEVDELYINQVDTHMRLCVQYHQNLLKQAKILDKALALIMFTQILSSSFLLAIIGVLMATAKDSSTMTMGATYLSYVLMETGLLCWIATQLRIQSEMVGQAAYNCMWYGYPKRIKLSLRFIIKRSQKPVILSLGPFGSLSMELFGKILNSAYSYFTLMKDVSRN